MIRRNGQHTRCSCCCAFPCDTRNSRYSSLPRYIMAGRIVTHVGACGRDPQLRMGRCDHVACSGMHPDFQERLGSPLLTRHLCSSHTQYMPRSIWCLCHGALATQISSSKIPNLWRKLHRYVKSKDLSSSIPGQDNLMQACANEWKKLTIFSQYTLVTFSLYAATMVIIKISLGIFYLRIVVSTWQKVIIYITVGVATIYGSYYFFAILFQCGMPSDFLLNALQGHCAGTKESRFRISMAAGIINAITDFILAILPIFLISKACMPLSAKISASLVLLLGCIGSAISVVRLAYVHGLTYNLDFFEVGVKITLWSIIEVGLCITAASLATLRLLFSCCVERTRRSMTPAFSSNHSSKFRHHRRSSTLSFQDRSPPFPPGNENWPLQRPDSVVPDVRELDDMRAPSPGFSDPGVTRKASLINGKVQWLEAHVRESRPTPRIPPRRPARPQWPSSEDHPAFRLRPAMSASNFTYAPDQLLRTASKLTNRSLGGDTRGESNDSTSVRCSGQPKLQEVGVGAWRVCDEKADRKGTSGR